MPMSECTKSEPICECRLIKFKTFETKLTLAKNFIFNLHLRDPVALFIVDLKSEELFNYLLRAGKNTNYKINLIDEDLMCYHGNLFLSADQTSDLFYFVNTLSSKDIEMYLKRIGFMVV